MEKANTRGAADATGGSPHQPARGPTTGPGFVTTQRVWRVMTDATLRYRAAYWIRGRICRSRSYFLSTSSSRDEVAPSSTAVRWQVAYWWKRLWRPSNGATKLPIFVSEKLLT